MREYTPDYKRLEAAAWNRDTGWIPLYEHLIGDGVIGAVMGTDLTGLLTGDSRDRLEYFRIYCEFFKKMGYDTVSWEGTIGETMPGSGALGRHVKGVIQTREDFEAYPWDTLPDRYFETYGQCFEALREAMPAGMKAVGGVGNGIFECVQDLVGYEDLCYMRVDDPELYEDLFRKVGENNLKIWQRFLREYGDIYCVCRFGDDLGFKSNTLLPAEEIRTLVIPQYRNIVDAVHQTGKPFLLHSCGQIFGVMDDLIRDAHIDAKHSNEDQIAPLPGVGGEIRRQDRQLRRHRHRRRLPSGQSLAPGVYYRCGSEVHRPRRLRLRLRQLHPGLCPRGELSEHEPDHPGTERGMTPACRNIKAKRRDSCETF